MNMKKLGGMEKLKDNEGVYDRIQGLNCVWREKYDFSTHSYEVLKNKVNEIELTLNE